MFQIKTVKTERIYEVTDTPVIQGAKFAVRTETLTVRLQDGFVWVVSVEGRRIRRDGTLGAPNTIHWHPWTSWEPQEPPAAINALLAAESLVWRKAGAR